MCSMAVASPDVENDEQANEKKKKKDKKKGKEENLIACVG